MFRYICAFPLAWLNVMLLTYTHPLNLALNVIDIALAACVFRCSKVIHRSRLGRMGLLVSIRSFHGWHLQKLCNISQQQQKTSFPLQEAKGKKNAERTWTFKMLGENMHWSESDIPGYFSIWGSSLKSWGARTKNRSGLKLSTVLQ